MHEEDGCEPRFRCARRSARSSSPPASSSSPTASSAPHLSLSVALEGFEATMAGLVLSSYFAGFTLGAVRSDRIIARIGHIRAYAAFARPGRRRHRGHAAARRPLRLAGPARVVGFGCAGLFVATESWLNAKAPPAMRGRVFAIYMVGTFMALAAGTASDRPDRRRCGRAVQRDRGPVRRGARCMVSTTRAEPPQVTAAAAMPPIGSSCRRRRSPSPAAP